MLPSAGCSPGKPSMPRPPSPKSRAPMRRGHRRRPRAMTAWAALLMLISSAPAAEDAPPAKMELPKPGPDGKIALFNGKDLTGWYGEPGLFSVDNGEIVGKTEKGLKRNEFLKSRFEAADFRLTLKIKLVPNGANSGVQFRSQPFKGNEMKGYQADAGP